MNSSGHWNSIREEDKMLPENSVQLHPVQHSSRMLGHWIRSLEHLWWNSRHWERSFLHILPSSSVSITKPILRTHPFFHRRHWDIISIASVVKLKKKNTLLLRTALLWVVTHRVLVIPYRRFVFLFLTLEEGTDQLSRNVDKELPLLAA